MNRKPLFSFETFVFLFFLIIFFWIFTSTMGSANFFKTLMSTAHDLLLNTVFFIMAVAVLTGAFAALLNEFGVIYWIHLLLDKLMKPLYNLPGIAAMGILSTYFSDNPAIIALAKDKSFISHFEKWQEPLLCNLGTAFGMGMIVSTFFIAQGGRAGVNLVPAVIVGNIATIIGSIVSVRLFSIWTKKKLGSVHKEVENVNLKHREIREGNAFERFLEAMLDGGKTGVDIGIGIIPGVLIISTLVMMLTFGPKDNSVGYQGLAYEGIALFDKIGKYLFWPLKILFGFDSPQLIAFPITCLGSTGAALALVPRFMEHGLIKPSDVAVFTAIGMTWSGYLSTHVGMMDALGYRYLTSKAILSHTIGGIVAGFSANLMYNLFIHI
ncbi:CD0519/CD1768 family membrane protein [Fervidobacterium nodosum]|uniref:Membrane protein n=1 Tax=Fervidobacterium nodosum (strain ATCC 35602 / DSM 5306 / Rt17-B1) TaxID=381764 RepID=A7HJG4_FERNB|nr:membrane protein [Fervidobacterium nodosum]ABS60047.1 membrane protein [Fervidobacterium nodosum Rt17-B1]